MSGKFVDEHYARSAFGDGMGWEDYAVQFIGHLEEASFLTDTDREQIREEAHALWRQYTKESGK